MTILIAPNAYKGTLTAYQACHALYTGMKSIFPRANFILCPLADGGDGTLEVLKFYDKALKVVRTNVINPEGRKISASFLYNAKTKHAYLECSEATGMKTLKCTKRNIMRFTSHGTGELILKALDEGVKKITVGIGGTATNDGGLGMLRALGFKFSMKNGNEIKTPDALIDLHKISTEHAEKRLKTTQFFAACDVNSPLLGRRGATMTYSGQKGAGAKEKNKLEASLRTFSLKSRAPIGKNINLPFCGAGGGMGAALYGYLNADCDYGFNLVEKMSGLEQKIKKASFVVTGEGKIDFQTKYGKVPFFVARLCKKWDIPCFCIPGTAGMGAEALHREGMTGIFPCVSSHVRNSVLKKHAHENLRRKSREVANIIKSSGGVG